MFGIACAELRVLSYLAELLFMLWLLFIICRLIPKIGNILATQWLMLLSNHMKLSSDFLFLCTESGSVIC